MKNILGLDPGTRNFGVSVLLHRPGRPGHPGRFVLRSWHLTSMVWDLKQEQAVIQARAFEREIRAIIKKYRIGAIVMERYQPRRTNRTIIEPVNIMIGLVLGLARRQTVSLLTAATWKNAIKKYCNLKWAYDRVRSPHQLDAVCMALYCHSQLVGKPPFFMLRSDKTLLQVVSRLGKVPRPPAVAPPWDLVALRRVVAPRRRSATTKPRRNKYAYKK